MKTLKLDKMLYGWIFGFLKAITVGVFVMCGLDFTISEMVISLVSKLWIAFDGFLKTYEIMHMGDRMDLEKKVKEIKDSQIKLYTIYIDSMIECKNLPKEISLADGIIERSENGDLKRYYTKYRDNLIDKKIMAEVDVEMCQNEYKDLGEKQIKFEKRNEMFEEAYTNAVENRKWNLMCKSHFLVKSSFIIAGVGTAIVIFIKSLG